jgi:hypothetical protein
MYSVANLWSTHDFLALSDLDERYDGLRPLLRDLVLRLNEAMELGFFDLLTGAGSTGEVYKNSKVTTVQIGRLAWTTTSLFSMVKPRLLRHSSIATTPSTLMNRD